jgi:predicted nucleic acid-binding protein
LSGAPRVYVDSQILIYSGELDPRYWPTLRDLWREVGAGRVLVMTSQLSILECLVYPLRLGDTATIAAFEAMFVRPDLEMLPIDLAVPRAASRLRADVPSLRTPDALHAATALTAGASMFLTNDAGLRRLPALTVRLLSDGPIQFS